MSHSFDVRFARSTGFLAWLEASPNSLRWKGAGRLSIDAEGISIAVKRGLTTLFSPRSRRISAHDLTEVYREADALRLEFNAAGDSREVLPLWASGSDAAAEIVKLLPTQRTIELEHSTGRSPPYRLDWSAVGRLVVGGLVLAALAWGLHRVYAPPQVPSADAAQAPVESVPARESAPPSNAAADEPVEREYPIARTSPAYAAARRHVDDFEAERTALYADFLKLQESPSPVELEALQGRWTSLLQQIRYAPGYSGPELEKLRLKQYAVCLGWRSFLSMYAEGLRTWNSEMTTASFLEREKAEAALERLRWYVP
jgi:hypothetical protein